MKKIWGVVYIMLTHILYYIYLFTSIYNLHTHMNICIISTHESHHEIDKIQHFILRISAYVSIPCQFLKVYVKSNTYLLY